jgi:RNA polymerase sigma factor (sigma-70 family)
MAARVTEPEPSFTPASSVSFSREMPNAARTRVQDRRGPQQPPLIPPFQSFVVEHRTAVYRFLLAAAGPDLADDCFQDTFLAALRAYPGLRDGRNLRGWVLAIASRKVIDGARVRRRQPERLPDDAETALPDPAIGEGPTVTDPRDPLWRAVQALPARQRVAVVQRFVLDRSYAEIAASMESTEEGARANVYQGLKKLRKGWSDGDHGDDASE